MEPHRPVRALRPPAFPHRRVCVVAPHPDDSALGAGGLIHLFSGLPNVRVRVFVATPGFRGVAPEFLDHNRRFALDALERWAGIRVGEAGDAPSLGGDLARALGDDFRLYGGPDNPVEARVRNALATAIRFAESWEEVRVLGWDPADALRFLALPHLYHGRITSGELTRLSRELADFTDDSASNLLLIPHPDDPQRVHRAVAEAAIRALRPDTDWQIWYYQSPWYSMHPERVDLVVAMEERDVRVKRLAAEAHQSQTSRTPYADIVAAQATLNADVLPEQLLGYGGSEPLALGRYCELYQVRLRGFYDPEGATDDLIVYSRQPLPIERAGGTG